MKKVKMVLVEVEEDREENIMPIEEITAASKNIKNSDSNIIPERMCCLR